ncbi:hypothetical protein [Streptomyces sp. NPDC003996]
MESGYLVMRRQDGNRGEKYVGTVRLVEGDSAVIEWPGGRRSRILLPVPSDITVIPVGSVRYRALRDFQELKKEFSKSPVPVLVALLEEMGQEATVKQLHDEARQLGLAGEHNNTWWISIRQRLLEHPRVTESKPNGSLKLIDDPFQKERSLPAREALEFLATPATKRPRELEQALREAVRAGQRELTAYERVAAHALKVPLPAWPVGMNDYTPQGVSQKVLAVAVEFLAEVTKGQRHAKNPTAEPSPKLGKGGAPPAVALTPLLVGLVTIPEDSAAADQAAQLPRGLMAQSCVMALMARFESEDCTTAEGDRLLSRGAVLLPGAFAESPLVPAAQCEAFARKLLGRALGLLLRSAEQRLPSDPECKWIDLVLAAVPEHTLRHGVAATDTEDLVAALKALPDRPDGSRERVTLVLASLADTQDKAGRPETPSGPAEVAAKATDSISAGMASGSAEEAATEEPKEQESQTEPPTPATTATADARAQKSEAGGGAGPVEEAPAEEPKTQEPPSKPPSAATDDAGTPAQESGETDDTPASAAEAPSPITDFAPEERSRYDIALSQERGVAQALRSERDELKQELAAMKRRYDRVDEEFAELRARLDAATTELAAATRRGEALALQAQRREQELRHARQAGRAASQSQLRQARLDGLRVLAAVLAEVADQAAHATDESDPSCALYRRVLAQAATAGLMDIGTIGEETEFDPSRHQAPTGPAEWVVVERPGFAWRAAGTQEEVVLLPAQVRRAEP